MIRAARAHVWLDADRPSENFSDGAAMAIEGTSRYAYLSFGLPSALSPVPGRKVTVTSATLRVYTRGSWALTPTLSVSRVDREWVPGRVTWTRRPGVFAAEVTKSQSSAADAHEWTFDLTTFVQNIANGAVWNGLRISTTYATAPLWLYSTDARDAVLPTLEVEWSEAPRAPVELSPSGGRSVSLARPVLQCDFVDRAGARRMQSLHFQVNTSNAWATPMFDSGVVAKSEPELDLASTTIAALTNASVYWWRGRVQDAAGLWSDWSDGVQFGRTAKGTLDITNPAVGPLSSQNLARNPSFETNALLWTTSNCTLARVSTWAERGAWSGEVAVTTAGVATNVYAQGVSGVFLPCASGDRLNARVRVQAVVACRVRLTAQQYSASSAGLGEAGASSYVDLAAGAFTTLELRDAVASHADAAKWLALIGVFASGGAGTAPNFTGPAVRVDGMYAEASGAAKGYAVGQVPYGDGDTAGWGWTGTAHASTSGPFQTSKVDEWTPPILATLTGRTAEAFAVAISDAADPGFDLYDSGRIRGTEIAHTLPKGVLEDDRTYEVRVRAWDTIDREATPGDPPFVAAIRQFVFKEDVTTDPVQNLTATQVGSAPWVDVSFTRASAPDYFVLKRNGRVIESKILPQDIMTTGTGYTIRDDDAPPYEPVTYRVQAVVNGKTSANNPGVDITVRPDGVWLRDRSRDLEVVIYGEDPVAWESPDQASDYQPLGSAETIRVTQGLSAYTGTVSGVLTADLGVSMGTLNRRMMLFKERPNEILTMTTGTRTIRCRIGDVATWPTDDPRDFGVSFSFRQCGLLEWASRR